MGLPPCTHPCRYLSTTLDADWAPISQNLTSFTTGFTDGVAASLDVDPGQVVISSVGPGRTNTHVNETDRERMCRAAHLGQRTQG